MSEEDLVQAVKQVHSHMPEVDVDRLMANVALDLPQVGKPSLSFDLCSHVAVCLKRGYSVVIIIIVAVVVVISTSTTTTTTITIIIIIIVITIYTIIDTTTTTIIVAFISIIIKNVKGVWMSSRRFQKTNRKQQINQTKKKK